ncbi:peroxidase 11-like [Nymphaea colorata]|nr:peroxidase 11-like [Nymphaea colorata]
MKILLFFLFAMLAMTALAQPYLTQDYYSGSCPSVVDIVRREMIEIAIVDRPKLASILRLHFHDCFVQGCDGSIFLESTDTMISEQEAIPNKDSIKGLDTFDNIKTAVEAECPGVVSCADVLAIAARDAVILSGGPYWDVPLGRKDSTTANFVAANINIPLPNQDLGTLLAKFLFQGLSLQDMVALVGAHTIGVARCVSFRERIYGDFLETVGLNPISHAYLFHLKALCPEVGGDDNTSPMDNITPIFFDNSFYQILVRGEGLLNSDQEMYSSLLSGDTKPLVIQYAADLLLFYKHFTESMLKMGNITDPLSYATGEVRRKCNVVNS